MSRSVRFGVWLLAAAMVFLASPSEAGPGYVNFVLGQKLFDSEDWDPIDKQPVFGVEAAFGPSTWPVHMMTFLQRSSKSKDVVIEGVTVERESDTWEVGVGVNKTWAAGKIYPYVGAGLDYAKVDMTFHEGGTTASDDGNGFGVWGWAGRVLPDRHAVQSRRHDALQLGRRGLQRVRHGELPVRRRRARCGGPDVRVPRRLGLAGYAVAQSLWK